MKAWNSPLLQQIDQNVHFDLLDLHLDVDRREHGDDGLDDRQPPALVLTGGPFELEAVLVAGLGEQLLRLLGIEC